MVVVKEVFKRFGRVIALNGVSFEVGPSEVFGLLGPNGSGKTTLLNVMAGVTLPTGGSVEIDGVDMAKDPVKAKGAIGYVPDSPYYYPRLTGYEFLDFVGGLYGVECGKRGDRIAGLSRLLELEEWLNKLMEGYPRGVRQKLMLAAALLHEPKVLLSDEPTANLDPKSARLAKDVFKKLAGAQGVAIIVSTHILEIAEKICDRIAILNKGEIVASGTMSELRQKARAHPEANLEELFLGLTGGKDYAELISYL
jgi:ABC-2 type transport system ATP-binding protein